MYEFGGWQDEIKRVSTDPQFQNAAVVIYVPGTLGEYNPSTGNYDGDGATDPTLVYSGRCRVVGLRSARGDNVAYDPDSLKSVRVQLAENPSRIPNQARAYFTNGGRNANLTMYEFAVNMDFNSSHVAAYTLELTVAGDLTDDDRPVFP